MQRDGKNTGFSIKQPRFIKSDWKLAYGLECIRIWKESIEHLERTGNELDIPYPTEDEFRTARKEIWRRRLYYAGADGRIKK